MLVQGRPALGVGVVLTTRTPPLPRIVGTSQDHFWGACAGLAVLRNRPVCLPTGTCPPTRTESYSLIAALLVGTERPLCPEASPTSTLEKQTLGPVQVGLARPSMDIDVPLGELLAASFTNGHRQHLRRPVLAGYGASSKNICRSFPVGLVLQKVPRRQNPFSYCGAKS